MGEAVEQSAGEAFGAEDLGPFLEWPVAGDQRRCAFVALTEGLEQQLGAALGRRDIRQFIDDEKLIAGKQFMEAQQVFVVASFDQFADQGGGSGKAYTVALLAS